MTNVLIKNIDKWLEQIYWGYTHLQNKEENLATQCFTKALEIAKKTNSDWIVQAIMDNFYGRTEEKKSLEEKNFDEVLNILRKLNIQE